MDAPKAFPTIAKAVLARAAEHGVDLEQSFRGFMAELLNVEPDSERVDRLIADGLADGHSCSISSKSLRAVADVSPRRTSDATLTPRQREALLFVARGYTREEAAREMGNSAQTVKRLLTQTYDRLDAATAAHAVAVALRSGIIHPDEIEDSRQLEAA